jgi:pimeloyl-ACP methyl ester carboxylesterase
LKEEKLMLPEIAIKKDLVVNGRTYPIIEAGEGPLVVCLHGFPDNYESFQHQIKPFVAAGYRIVCPMMPGFAPGTEPSSGSNTPVYAVSEIIALIEILLNVSGEKKCHLVGHDWGALISYMVAAERPDLLSSHAALSIPYNVNLLRVILRCPSYGLGASWYVSFFQLKGLADWWVKQNNWKFIDMLYRTWCPTWENYDDRLVSTKETLKAPGVLKSCLSYYRNSLFGLNSASFKFRRLFNGTITVPTLGIRGEVDGCIPEVAWEQVSPKSFRNGLTLEVMPGIGHFPQLENPQWISERLVGWVNQHSPASG